VYARPLRRARSRASGRGAEQRLVDLAHPVLGEPGERAVAAVGHDAAVVELGHHEARRLVVGAGDGDLGLHVGEVDGHDAVLRVVVAVGRGDRGRDDVAVDPEAPRAEDLGVAHHADRRPGADVVDLVGLREHLGGGLEVELPVAVAGHEDVLLGAVGEDHQVLHHDDVAVGRGEVVLLDVADQAQVDLGLAALRGAGAAAEEGVHRVHVVGREVAAGAVDADDLRRLAAVALGVVAELEVVAEAVATAAGRELVPVEDAVEEVHDDPAAGHDLEGRDAVAGEHRAGLGVLHAEVAEVVDAEVEGDAAPELLSEKSREPLAALGAPAGGVGASAIVHGSRDLMLGLERREGIGMAPCHGPIRVTPTRCNVRIFFCENVRVTSL
jgi:hypothetical protein